jgi:2-haloacid dehalogenase
MAGIDGTGRGGDDLVSRRQLLAGLAGGSLAAMTSRAIASPPAPRIKAIAFDAFPIFDIRSVAAVVRSLFPEKGDALASAWTAKLFSSTWLLSSAERYVDFESVARASLKYAADSVGIDSTAASAQLVQAYAQLPVWPDVLPALERLRSQGIRMAFLSNMGESMLRTNMRRAGIERYFEQTLSTDRVRRYKPSPIAYRMAIDALGLKKQEIGFAAFAGWDAIGAAWFGFPTVWVNRLNAPREPFDVQPNLISADLEGVLSLTAAR